MTDVVDETPPPIRAWLSEAAQRSASDLHLVAGYPPIRREHGVMLPMDSPPLDATAVRAALRSICAAEDFARFERERNLDFALEFDAGDPGQGKRAQRFRVNCFYSGEEPGACLRVIPATIPELGWCNFPVTLAERICSLRNGLVVFPVSPVQARRHRWR